MKNVCLVSAYFEIKSKFSKEKYQQWMRNFLQIRTPMVVFTNRVDLIREYRGKGLSLVVVECQIEDFYVYRYLDKWLEQHQMDHEKNIHNINLYMIWNEKSNFIKRAIELDPFQSEYFYWTDIGSFRDSGILQSYYLDYPKKVTKKILLLNIEPFDGNEREMVNEEVNIFQYKNRIGGGIFGGCREKCLEWWEKYYAILDSFISHSQFAGKDQSIMATVALLNPELVEVVGTSGARFDPWFYLQEYLTLVENVYVINLQDRMDRWKLIRNELGQKSKVLNPIRFVALEGTPGWKFCALSHLALIEKAMEDRLPYLIVMEDDTVIRNEKFDLIFNRILFYLDKYADQWDIFNGNPSVLWTRPNQQLEVIYPYPLMLQYEFGKTTNFLIYNKSCYQKVLKLRPLFQGVGMGVESDYERLAYDKMLCELGLKLVTRLPYLTTQRDGYSNIEGGMVRYDQCIMEHGNDFAIERIRRNYVSGKLLGGLGNQMFILAVTWVTALRSGLPLTFKKTNWIPCEYRKVNEYWDTFFNFIELAVPYDGEVNLQIQDAGREYDLISLDIDRNGGGNGGSGEDRRVELEGYFQNAGYFQEYRDEIRDFFQPSQEVVNYLYGKYKWLGKKHKVLLHVRRGDYVIKKDYHHNVPLEYYYKCLAPMLVEREKYLVVVFSDDIPWCHQHFGDLADIYIEGEEDWREIYLMTYFDIYILSNSTFCWWGAYLARKTTGIEAFMPCKWFEDGRYPAGLVLDGWQIVQY